MPHLYRLQDHTFQPLIWGKSEMLLGTFWELGEQIANIVGTHYEQRKSKTPHLPQKKKTIWDKSEVLLGTWKTHWGFIGNIMGTPWEHLGNLKNTLEIQWDHVGTHCEQ